ncbi:hypothetical protein N0V92_013954, partial [Colletotrichum tropicale]
LTDAVNLHVLDDIDTVDDYLPVSSGPHRDTLYLDEDDGGNVDLGLSPCKRPALPPHLPAKLGRPWLRYIASLALPVALVWLSVWVLLPVFQRPLVFAIPIHRPYNNNNLLEAYDTLDLMLFSEIKRDLQPEREHHSLAPTPNPLVDDRSELLRYFSQLPLLLAKVEPFRRSRNAHLAFPPRTRADACRLDRNGRDDNGLASSVPAHDLSTAAR